MNSLAARIAAGVLLLGAMGAAADDRDDEVVCVPAEDGRSWACGTRANPPPERSAPVVPRRTAGAPPPFLAAPGGTVAPLAPADRPARDAFPPAPDRDPPASAVEVRQVADADDTTVEPLPEQPAAATTTSPPPDAPSASMTAPPQAPPPLLAAPRPRRAPYAPVTPVAAAPAPAMAEPAAAEPLAAEPVAAEPVAAEPTAAEPVAAEPVAAQPMAPEPAVTPLDTPPVADGEAFLALPADRATLQLARATRVGDLYATWQRMVADSGGALARGTAYVITLDAGGTPQALLLWSDLADAAAARAAWETLPGFSAGKPAAYARRVAPLQDEIRRSAPSR
ncbi:MAG: hypothetical protein LW860_12130 [Xanthomonadaceae bacterium]|jgi:hypothetical protein|nr:hypothetical protein [Xanthomonadaceae bacterium]